MLASFLRNLTPLLFAAVACSSSSSTVVRSDAGSTKSDTGSAHSDAAHGVVDAAGDSPAEVSLDAGVQVASCSDCAAGELCVVTVAGGGACEMPNDAGLCPNGSKGIPMECCDNSTTTTVCWPKAGGCGTTPSCDCASRLCNNYCGCQGLTDAGAVSCACDYP